METVVSGKVGDILDKFVSKVETACRICSVSLTDYFDRIREIVGAIGEKMISLLSHFALLDIVLDKLLDIKKKCLVVTRQILYPGLAVPISSHRWGNRNIPA
jgi:hypothetical protein